MNSDTFTLSYPPVYCGTEKTDIFFSGAPDFDTLGTEKPRIFVTDEHVASIPAVAELLDSQKNTPRVVLKPGEKEKTADTVLSIVKTALEARLPRSALFTGIGGGVVCDLTAFASSIYMRGAGLETVPTTLLAMADAAVGGKTGCDLSCYKNMIGTFYPASKLYMMRGFLDTLSDGEYRSGLAEVLKTALLYAPKLFQIMQDNSEAVLRRDPELLGQIVKRCVQAKAHIVEKDLQESGLRMQLNFGHTFAHALETFTGLGAVTHGDAVAWGIGRALDLSVRLGLCESSYRDEVAQVLGLYGWVTAARHPAADAVPEDGTGRTVADRLAEIMKKDKKNRTGGIRCVLQREMNSTVIQDVPAEDVAAVLDE